MIDKFLEGLGNKLADQWVATVLVPAFVFWGGALLAWIMRFGWNQLATLFNQLSPIAQVAVLIGGLVGIAASSFIIQRLDRPVVRLLEGYWPHWLLWLRRWKVRRQHVWLDPAKKHWQELAEKVDSGKATVDEQKEYLALDLKLRLFPKQTEKIMPTKLGNILRSAENRPWDKYGLDAVICWPRLWLLLPEEVKKELSEARASLDSAARTLLWGVLFLVWTIWAWWALLVGLIIAIWAYQWAINAAEVYGDLLESTFDLHRFSLYDMLRWPPPENSVVEKEEGTKLTRYLFRGILASPVTFKNPTEKKE